MEEDKRRNRRKETESKELKKRQLRLKHLLIRCVIGVLAFAIGVGAGWFSRGLTIRGPVDLSAIKAPEWVEQQFLTVNPYSRPGTKLGVINNIVVHYVGNPGTTAQQNRDYFEGLKNQSGSNTTSVSSNFIIGLDGEIIQCIPVDEKSFASNDRNIDTISIECCHPGADGEFTQETYDSLVKLTAWLCKELKLSYKDVIRHYDVKGKACPKTFVENEDDWKRFRKDVRKAIAKLD